MTVLRSRLLAALAVAAGAAVLFAPRPLAVAGGLLLAFVLPGMALVGALFTRRTLTSVERSMLAPALSMGVLIVAGLAIHGAGLRIDRLGWTVATVGVTLVAVAAARLPGRRAPAAGPAGGRPRPLAGKQARTDAAEHTVRLPVHGVGEAHTVVMSIAPPLEVDDQRAALEEKARRRRLLWQFLPLILAGVVLGGASWLSFETSRDTHDTTVTALSATPSGPVNVAGNRTVRVTATGLLAADGPYTIRVTGRNATTLIERVVAVTGDGTWDAALNLPGAQRITVDLYRSGDTTAYRTLSLSAVE
jgi:hypothetical protein